MCTFPCFGMWPHGNGQNMQNLYGYRGWVFAKFNKQTRGFKGSSTWKLSLMISTIQFQNCSSLMHLHHKRKKFPLCGFTKFPISKGLSALTFPLRFLGTVHTLKSSSPLFYAPELSPQKSTFKSWIRAVCSNWTVKSRFWCGKLWGQIKEDMELSSVDPCLERVGQKISVNKPKLPLIFLYSRATPMPNP